MRPFQLDYMFHGLSGKIFDLLSIKKSVNIAVLNVNEVIHCESFCLYLRKLIGFFVVW